MVKKFVGQYDLDINSFGLQRLNLSWPNRASKSAFPVFHGNRSEFKNFNPSTVLSDPDGMSVSDLVTIGRETAK